MKPWTLLRSSHRTITSEPAAKFEVTEKPNDWTKEVKKNESANETQQQRYDYWMVFQDYAFQNAQFDWIIDVMLKMKKAFKKTLMIVEDITNAV